MKNKVYVYRDLAGRIVGARIDEDGQKRVMGTTRFFDEQISIETDDPETIFQLIQFGRFGFNSSIVRNDG